MAEKIRKLILGLLCLLFYLGPCSSQSRQGQKLEFFHEFYSGGEFRMGFIGFATTTYVGIWYNGNKDHVSSIVWVANGDNPILNVNKPKSLTIDDYKQQKSFYCTALRT